MRTYDVQDMTTEQHRDPQGAYPPSAIAWCGWRIDGPDAWRPLKITGDPAKGSMMIGDGERPVLFVQWRQVGARGFDADTWLSRRFRKLRALPDTKAPRPRGVETAAWVREIELREGQSKSVWCGYSRAAELLLELVTTNVTGHLDNRETLEQVLPTLSVSGHTEACLWSLYGVGLLSPPGFKLVRRHLFSGDIALGFKRRGREGLLLRQVYPAGMAVSRRPLERWLKMPPFTERRRPPKRAPQAWSQQGLEGMARTGWRHLPSPMGWCNPRYATAIAAVDAGRDRLLIAERVSPREHGVDLVTECILNMNRQGAADA